MQDVIDKVLKGDRDLKVWGIDEVVLDTISIGESLGMEKILEGNNKGIIFKVNEL